MWYLVIDNVFVVFEVGEIVFLVFVSGGVIVIGGFGLIFGFLIEVV